MIVVTGGAGFIGRSLIAEINKQGRTDVILVDDLSDPRKLKNVVGLEIDSFVQKNDFIELLNNKKYRKNITQIYHYGAESATTCKDSTYLMKNNYEYSKTLLEICVKNSIPLQYASSAAVYGNSKIFDDSRDDYLPTNVYGYTKLLIDRLARKYIYKSCVQVLRFFNVCSDGEFETHKDGMKSPTAWMKDQLRDSGAITLFKDSEDYFRDFIQIENVIDMALKLMPLELNTQISGIFNIGTGTPSSFYAIARTITHEPLKYIDMPVTIKEHYQKYTKADLTLFNHTTR